MIFLAISVYMHCIIFDRNKYVAAPEQTILMTDMAGMDIEQNCWAL